MATDGEEMRGIGGWQGKQEALEVGMDSHRGAVSRKVKECKLGFRKFPKYSGMELRAQLLSRGQVALPPSLREGRRVGSCPGGDGVAQGTQAAPVAPGE